MKNFEPEEVFIVSGRLHDQAFDLWLEAGHYASRPGRRTARTVQDGCGVRRAGGIVSQSR